MEKGFTLVELVIAMGMVMLLLAGVIFAHRHQTRSGSNLALAVAVQQNLRAALYHLEWDIRMAGADLRQTAYATTVPILTAEHDRIAFSWDQDGNGIIDPAKEIVEYFLYHSNYLGTTNLQRRQKASSQPVAQNIDALNFVYYGPNRTTPMTFPLSADDRRYIRAVQITLVGRTRTPLKLGRVEGRQSYLNQEGDLVLSLEGDNYRRIQLSGGVTLRNIARRK